MEVTPHRPSFLSEQVAKTKRNRQAVRVVLLAFVLCGITASGSGASPTEMLRFSVIDGSCFAAMLLFVRRFVPSIRFSSFAVTLLFRSIVYTFVFIFCVGIVVATIRNGHGLIDFFRRRPGVLEIGLAFFYFEVLLVTGIRGISRKLGPRSFWLWLRGYYYSPKEEERIFMFLDMRGSTSLAEKLGDLKFSMLIRDFFDDLTSPVVETRAEVSHYIGDEVVLTWPPNVGLPGARCLELFFRAQAAIDRRREYYQEKYGVVPEFKAGAHIGRVVATEVGQIKSEIVFHGDVLNTTARVQGACSEYNADLLITEALAKRLPPTAWLTLQPIGAAALKGKSEPIQLYAGSVNAK